MSRLSAMLARLTHLTLSELSVVVGSKIPLPPINPSFLDRIFNQERTLWLFLGQILSATQSCQEALKKAQMWLAFSDKKKHLIQYVRLLSGASQTKFRLP
jgi:hypothetical protein